MEDNGLDRARKIIDGLQVPGDLKELLMRDSDLKRIATIAAHCKDEETTKWIMGELKDILDILYGQTENELPTVRIRTIPVGEHKAPVDKVTNRLFNPTTKQWETGTLKLIEDPNKKSKMAKAGNDPITTIKLVKPDSLERLDPFDRMVLETCCSLFAAGNLATTTDIFFAHMTGSNNRERATKKMRQDIEKALMKISSIWMDADTTSANKAFGYKESKTRGQLLYTKFEKRIVNGNEVNAIVFWKESPLYQIAQSRSQIYTYPKELLDVPIKATRETIGMKGELLRAVLGIVKHNLTPTILFSSVFDPCGYNEMDKQQQQRMRKKAVAMMDTWKEKGLFENYSIWKERQTPVKFIVVPLRKKDLSSFSPTRGKN